MKISRKLSILLLKFYQKYLTIFSYGSCRYIPTCSQYAMIQFEYNNIFRAFYNSTLRILRCNQLFEGGFDYPLIKYSPNKCNFKKIRVKYWLIPISNGKYKVIKNWN